MYSHTSLAVNRFRCPETSDLFLDEREIAESHFYGGRVWKTRIGLFSTTEKCTCRKDDFTGAA
jgi:hypothetical protein